MISPAVSLVQFTDDAEENNAVVLSCLAINGVMVPERDEASACHAVVRFVREHLKIALGRLFLRGDEARARGDARRRGRKMSFVSVIARLLRTRN